MAAVFKEYPNARFSIEGHTDSIGSSTLNQNLSDSRATAVMEYLIKSGVEASRLVAKGFGEDKPIASNSTREGRTSNRRVEIILITN
jgi:outer membrane protein OmpA-like peptidoglycan-associated protein